LETNPRIDGVDAQPRAFKRVGDRLDQRGVIADLEDRL
jgi:hypothetical protein